jgi:putative membrane protein
VRRRFAPTRLLLAAMILPGSAARSADPRRPERRWPAVRLAGCLALLAGLAAATVLVAWQGLGTVAAAMGALGAGIILLPAIYAPHIAGAAASWGLLFAPGRRPPFLVVLRAVWIGLSVETLLPAASLGAEAAKARLLMHSGVRAGEAAGSVVADMTVQAMVLAFWALAGIGALVSARAEAGLVWAAAAGAALLAAAIGGLLLAQRAGLFGLLARATGRVIGAARRQLVIDGAARLDARIRAIYDRPHRVVLACAIRCASRALLIAELWLVAELMGHPIAVGEAVMLVGIIGALRAATMVVPGGWGVQEGGFVLLGGLIGLAPDLALAMSLATRARELIVCLPALAVWQVLEGRKLRVRAGSARREILQSWTQPSH